MDSKYLEIIKSLPRAAETAAKSAGEIVLNFIKSIKSDSSDRQTTIIGLTLFFVGTQVYYWHKFSFWSRRNVKTPTPLPILGNFFSFLRYPRQHLEIEWPKKYGKIYGYYQGTQPYLVCTDVEVFKKIAIKDFDKFQNHYFIGSKNSYQRHILIFMMGDQWREIRRIITPTFTSGKIKVIYKLLNSCSNGLMEEFQKRVDDGKGSADIDMRSVYGTFSMGCALRSFYGIETIKGSKNPDDSIEGYAKRARIAFVPSPLRFIVSSLLPDRLLEKLGIYLVPDSRMEFFANKAKQIIQHRQRTGGKFNDYLQLLIDARDTTETGHHANELDAAEQHHTLIEGDSGSKAFAKTNKRSLTEVEVCCQALMLMMVATETTATLLTHVSYLLAEHQHVQQKLYEELCKIQKNKESEYDYEQLTTCNYLDSVIAEALRLMSPALAFDRVAMEDYYIEEYDIKVPKGTIVNLAFYAIHRDPDYWPEPEKYDPERFMPENKDKIISGSYCPFGIGPRSCVGFRFALTETKVALAKLVTQFHLERAQGTVYPPEPKKVTFVLNDNKNLLVSLKNRK